MSRWLRIFKRETIAAWNRRTSAGSVASCKTPSTRYRTISRSSNGSKWTSVARRSIASTRIWLTNWMIDASSASSVRSTLSSLSSTTVIPLVCISDCMVAAPTPRCLPSASAICSDSASTGSTSSPVVTRSSSIPAESLSELVATRSLPSTSSIGMSLRRLNTLAGSFDKSACGGVISLKSIISTPKVSASAGSRRSSVKPSTERTACSRPWP